MTPCIDLPEKEAVRILKNFKLPHMPWLEAALQKIEFTEYKQKKREEAMAHLREGLERGRGERITISGQ